MGPGYSRQLNPGETYTRQLVMGMHGIGDLGESPTLAMDAYRDYSRELTNRQKTQKATGIGGPATLQGGEIANPLTDPEFGVTTGPTTPASGSQSQPASRQRQSLISGQSQQSTQRRRSRILGGIG